jgi:hypothetical protein
VADIFLSYSQKDRGPAKLVVDRLNREGWSTWWDSSLVAGETWTDSIRAELGTARCVLVLWSNNSWDSRWVQAEAESAFARGVLVSARIDDVTILPPFNIIHTSDLRGRQGEKGLLDLVEGVRRKLKDRGPTKVRAAASSEEPPLQGQELKVELRATPVGIVLINVNDGSVVTDRKSLSQEVLAQVPRDGAKCLFVNLTTNSGQVVSCVVHGGDHQVFGESRAFWWSLARSTVTTTAALARARGAALGDLSLMDVCVSAQTAWNEAVIHHPISVMRDMPVWSRDVDLRDLSKMIESAPTEPARVGYKIALAMVLATQSEDLQLEARAYQAFKQYLWPPGDEPAEFAIHEAKR